MDVYIWQLIIWGVVFFFATPLAGMLVSGVGLLIGALTDSPAVAGFFILLGWITYIVLALFALFHTIRSVAELIQFASGG